MELIDAALAAVNAITDPAEKAEAWKKLFGDCCMDDVITNLNINSDTGA